VPTGRELARLKPPERTGRPGELWPKQFSPDGTRLLDGDSNVWDVGTGTVRLAVPGVHSNSSWLTPDGQALVVVNKAPSGSWLAYYDLTTGQEQAARRVPLAAGEPAGFWLGPATQDGRFLRVSLPPQTWVPPSPAVQWLSRLPGLGRLGHGQTIDAFVLVEAATGREVGRGNCPAWACTDGGRYVLSRSHDEVCQLWDVPPRKPWRRLLPVWAAWTSAIGLPGWWLFRRALRASRAAPETATAAPCDPASGTTTRPCPDLGKRT
jgi:hypothetical protein